jgi:hypothetical protein
MHIKSLLKFQCRIWGHRTRSVTSGRVSEGRAGPEHAYWAVAFCYGAPKIS